MRALKHWWQRATRGFDDSETWCLSTTTAEFLLPRLRRFKEVNNGHPHSLTEEEWDGILDEMIWSLEALIADEKWEDFELWIRVNAGLALIGKWWRDLWW